ncbi:LOG family protein [Actinoplanes hulinensis]|uniref:LOG family protein n=1 Tax=Actinoplanes hulinensis TaxID=1144547 RepID=A0ABS7B293_9ACTN|nr:LOG family protein [Actinoplanes hulinensis]MBW6434529.1 LOG family protein [Actinoplanes hulinensis]
MTSVQIAVCGPAECTVQETEQARRVGELLAGAGAVVLCGGGAGVMAAVAAGARSRGGLVVGVWSGDGRAGASPDLSATVVTGMGQARNAILVRSADALISVGGSWGTLSEIAHGMRRGDLPVVALGGWRIHAADGTPVPGIHYADTPEAAVEHALGRGRLDDVVAGWVGEDNLVRFLEELSRLIGYDYDHLDEAAPAADAPLRYPLMGTPPLEVELSQDPDGRIVDIRVHGAIDPVLAARIETMFALL